MIFKYCRDCDCGIPTGTRQLYCPTCRVKRTKEQKRDYARATKPRQPATRPCKGCGKTHTFEGKEAYCESCRVASKRASQKESHKKRVLAMGKTPRVLLTEEEKRAKYLARKQRYNDKVRNKTGITERKIARVEKLKKLTEIKEKKPKEHTEKNTDIPVYKNKSVDIEHRRFTSNEQRMIDEFLAKQHRNCA